ncbi:YggU-like protein [Cucurbitaria berberidis CBS 394.84]|uniref:YggU-like protein n=1 Tax=Cucurbitaria berberidis CBS 394.84 TaxID=1168544 RepID=A0A9P4LAE5_9PLEO|nr:YggU-like protein [Cucurbitaria berberidis CBS 394.84]KAF1848301.1 YggU-like protein [Cucurbitaria berberidis CBS 394.84]
MIQRACAPAIRFVVAKGAKGQSATVLHLSCHVKPGVNSIREGVASVSDESIEVCVAAQPRDGESNKSVRQVIADALGVPKSNVTITKGMKSREKTVAVDFAETKGTLEDEVERIKNMLLGSASR